MYEQGNFQAYAKHPPEMGDYEGFTTVIPHFRRSAKRCASEINYYSGRLKLSMRYINKTRGLSPLFFDIYIYSGYYINCGSL
jgi:hypothetical protein